MRDAAAAGDVVALVASESSGESVFSMKDRLIEDRDELEEAAVLVLTCVAEPFVEKEIESGEKLVHWIVSQWRV